MKTQMTGYIEGVIGFERSVRVIVADRGIRITHGKGFGNHGDHLGVMASKGFSAISWYAWKRTHLEQVAYSQFHFLCLCFCEFRDLTGSE